MSTTDLIRQQGALKGQIQLFKHSQFNDPVYLRQLEAKLGEVTLELERQQAIFKKTRRMH